MTSPKFQSHNLKTAISRLIQTFFVFSGDDFAKENCDCHSLMSLMEWIGQLWRIWQLWQLPRDFKIVLNLIDIFWLLTVLEKCFKRRFSHLHVLNGPICDVFDGCHVTLEVFTTLMDTCDVWYHVTVKLIYLYFSIDIWWFKKIPKSLIAYHHQIGLFHSGFLYFCFFSILFNYFLFHLDCFFKSSSVCVTFWTSLVDFTSFSFFVPSLKKTQVQGLDK